MRLWTGSPADVRNRGFVSTTATRGSTVQPSSSAPATRPPDGTTRECAIQDPTDQASLFPHLPIPDQSPAVGLSADARRTLRQRQDIEAGWHPMGRILGRPIRITDDPDQVCGNCRFRVLLGHRGKTYPKCLFGASDDLASPRISHSTATDIRAWWPACPDYEPETVDGTDATV